VVAEACRVDGDPSQQRSAVGRRRQKVRRIAAVVRALHGTANVLQVTVALWHVDETRVELVTSCAWAIKVTAHYKTIRMSHTTKSAKIKKKVILHSTTLTFWRCIAE